MGGFSVTDTAQLHADYHATLAQLRTQAPVYRIPEVGAYYITRYRDVKQVLMTPADFSSTAVRKLLYSGALTGGMPAYGGKSRALVEVDQMIGADPPEHSRLRAHISRPFMPARIAAYEAKVREICNGLLDKQLAEARDSIDIVNDIAVPMTLNTLAMFLGVEPEYYNSFREWTVAFIRGISGKIPSEEFSKTSGDMTDYLWTLVEARRREPRDDVITAVAQAQNEDPLYTDKDVIVTLHMLLAAGHETTTNLIANGTKLLSENPEQFQALKANPALLPKAIMEILRYDSPVSMQVRLTTRDVELGGTTIPENSLVMAGIGAANLDPEVMPDPERFDISRENREVIPFGYGIHFCAGAALAKLEGAVALSEIARRFRTLEPAGKKWEWHDSLIFRGPQSYHVKTTLS
jgi:cytochrome P450 PksS